MINLIGWLGAMLLAFCAVPEAILAIKNGHANGLSWPFLLMWYFGEIFILVPILYKIKEKFLIFNYSLNIICITIIIYYKLTGN